LQSLRDRFAAAVAAGDACDLARAALEIARIGHPDLVPDTTLRQLDELAAGARRHVPRNVAADVAGVELGRYLFEVCGFRGNRGDYYDVRNSFLNDVLERRVGIPITLSLVMMEVGARIGVEVEGVGFPGHFLVRIPGGRQDLLLDPFEGGTVVGRRALVERLRELARAGGGPEPTDVPGALIEAVGARAILARMLRNLLRSYVASGDSPHALAAVDLLLVLTPNAPEDLRTRGFLYEDLECHAAAAADLRCYLDLAPTAPDVDEVRMRLARLSDHAPTLH